MSEVTKPILLDETGQAIVSKLVDIKNAIEGAADSYPITINISTAPTKTQYSIGDMLDLSGIAVYATFSNSQVYDITPNCIFSPADGSKLGTPGDIDISVSWTWTPTSQTFTVNQEVNVTVPDWSTGTYAQLEAALGCHYDGTVDLSQYWNVGDERTEHLSAMAATGVDESHAAQDVVYVITNVGGIMLSDGVTECAFQVDQKDSLEEVGCINSSSSYVGSWEVSERRTWCNSVYKNALPSGFCDLFKEFRNDCLTFDEDGYYTGNKIVNDRFSLRGAEEVDGLQTDVYLPGGGTASVDEGSQVTYYVTSTNRIKEVDGVELNYWTRSQMRQTANFQIITKYANRNSSVQNLEYGLALFGVI